MEFSIEFYVTAMGRCPVREFLEGLKGSDPDDFAVLLAGLDKLKQRAYHRPPLSRRSVTGCLSCGTWAS